GLLDRRHDQLCAPRGGSEAVRLHAAAAALSGAALRPASVRMAFSAPGGVEVDVGYRVDGAGAVVDVQVDGEPLPGLRVGTVTADAVDLEVDGRRRQFRVSRAADPGTGGVVDVDSILGHTELVEIDRLPPERQEA
ncbi:MAG TPA: acetyl/propionyl-CoA carboxylase subunit alpha, partial [Acidimicrobiia bacterium]|nr:acetyl/propionyl-CoA carboxylase subunit alpha [Acidimicrobiia bacterium]